MDGRNKHLVVGVDVDGVIAQFVPAFASLCHRLTGKEVPEVATSWDWYKEPDGPLTKAEARTVWDHIIGRSDWWHGLRVTEDCWSTLSLLESLMTKVDTYFITTRPKGAKYWTEVWLQENGISTPTVLLSDNKGPLGRGLGLDVFVDDRMENVRQMLEHSPLTRSYLVDRPYNQQGREGLTVVGRLDEVWKREGLR